MNYPDTVRIEPTDSVGKLKPRSELIRPALENAGENAFGVQKVREIMEIQRAGLKGLRSTNLPTIQFYTAYGLNYPNFLFYPPVDQAYSFGFVGLRAQYTLSSIYHNKQKIAASQLRIKNLSIQQEALTEDIHQEVKSYNIKYYESLNRIAVIEKSIEQARINYSIVNTKYFNQLALLTDLLDADNLYQESRFNLVRAQTDALAVFYRMLYTAGKL
jgi:outer membrane protein